MSLRIGSQPGPHQIAGQLGKGGMGVVFRATDTKLRRDVAIKILPDEIANDPDRLNRFQQEAQVLAHTLTISTVEASSSRIPRVPIRAPDECDES